MCSSDLRQVHPCDFREVAHPIPEGDQRSQREREGLSEAGQDIGGQDGKKILPNRPFFDHAIRSQGQADRHVGSLLYRGGNAGRQDHQAGPGGPDLGIEHWVRHGMVGRGVVVDVAGYQASIGQPIDPRKGVPITVEMLQATLAHQKSPLQSGDVMMLRTGYVDAYLKASPEERVHMSEHHDCPGLHAGHEMTEFLWDSGISAIAADNPAVEVVPAAPDSGSAHRRLIPLLGFALGEFFMLGDIAEDCRRDGRYTCMFVAVPLHLPGAVGSPGNAIAIK